MKKVLTPSERKKHFRKLRKTKLSESDVRKIRNLVKEGNKQKHIAERYGLSAGYVSRIVSKDVWANI